MTTITSMAHKPGRVWGILSLIAVAVPLPFLLVLGILAMVVRNQESAGSTVEAGVYGLLAVGGLFFFPLLFVLATVLAVTAVRKPRIAGKVMGWITIGIVILAIPASWFAYQVWITNS
jgi:hypothetical protein